MSNVTSFVYSLYILSVSLLYYSFFFFFHFLRKEALIFLVNRIEYRDFIFLGE